MKLEQQNLLNLFFHLTSLPLLRPHSLVFVQGHVAGPTVHGGLNRLGKAGGLYSGCWAPEMAMLPVPTEAAQRLCSLVGFHLIPHQWKLIYLKGGPNVPFHNYKQFITSRSFAFLSLWSSITCASKNYILINCCLL